MIKHVLIPILMLLASYSVNAENLYQKDYDKFWGEFWDSQKEFVSCKSPKTTSSFIINSFPYGGNAEVTQAYAEEIENMALINSSCLIEGLSLLDEPHLDKFYSRFVEQATFNKPQTIINSIKKNKALKKYQNVHNLFK